ncbi:MULTISPECIES: hypothetical protein [unclassified Yoonia]|uniref:hypothetical protein n=1 Tax=unclassified Yoonia TaxID=2629118 RepID=UPI002AFE12F8|nr:MULTISPECIES: hypothetical protein [unclassified Yoonia]
MPIGNSRALEDARQAFFISQRLEKDLGIVGRTAHRRRAAADPVPTLLEVRADNILLTAAGRDETRLVA